MIGATGAFPTMTEMLSPFASVKKPEEIAADEPGRPDDACKGIALPIRGTPEKRPVLNQAGKRKFMSYLLPLILEKLRFEHDFLM